MRIRNFTLLILLVFACSSIATAQCYNLGWDSDPVLDPADPMPSDGETVMVVTFCNYADDLPVDPQGGQTFSICPNAAYLSDVSGVDSPAFITWEESFGCQFGTQVGVIPAGCFDITMTWLSIADSAIGDNGNDATTGLHCININTQPAGIHAGNACFDPADDAVDVCTWTEPLIIPVDLVKFNATKDGATTLLDWKTASEVNNSHFDVMRSRDGRSFEVIGTVQGVGNSTSLEAYNFVDENPFAGINYYQLEQVDFDGTTSKSRVRTVNFAAPIRTVIYPNPVVDYVMVETPQDNTTLNVYDTSGKLVLSNAIDAGTAINTASLSAGVYLFKVMDAVGNELSVDRVIVSK